MAAKSAVSAVWRRHTLGQKLARTGLWLLVAAAVAASLGSIEVIWEFLWDAPEQMADMVWRMWPPDFAYYPQEVHKALMETFHIATVGTIFSTVFALPLAILITIIVVVLAGELASNYVKRIFRA
jgi:phosphonate transport system permease protein